MVKMEVQIYLTFAVWLCESYCEKVMNMQRVVYWWLLNVESLIIQLYFEAVGVKYEYGTIQEAPGTKETPGRFKS